METISNAASAASKATFGEGSSTNKSGEEPVSGQTGGGTVEKPFDAGNAPENQPQINMSDMSGANKEPEFNHDRDMDDQNNREDPAYGSSKTDTTTDQPTTTGTSDTTSGDLGDKTDTSNLPSKPTTADESTGPTNTVSDTPTQSAGDPSSAMRPVQKQQGADRPTENPSDEQTSGIKKKKEAAEEGVSGGASGGGETKKDPNDHSGEPLGSVKHDTSGGDEKDDSSAPKGNEGTGEGTGEKWVKTTGMQAEGGDFDATKPGAGKEADRLLEQKGIHREQPGKGGDSDPVDIGKGDSAGGDSSSGGSKISKIKEKLHIGKK